MRTHTVELDEEQIQFLRGLVRIDLRRHWQGQAALKKKHGANFRPTPGVDRAYFIEGTYEALGGDPENITNVKRL